MSATALTLLICGTLTAALGAALVIGLSSRLRHEISALMRSFDTTERALVPLIAVVRTDRDRLAERLARLSDSGSGTDTSRQ